MFGDRSKRIAKIAASAAPHLEQGEEVRELFQVQSGQTAEMSRAAVHRAGERGKIDQTAMHGVQSFAVIATDRNAYVVTLEGWRLLDVGEVAYKEPLADASIAVHDDYVSIGDRVLHVMNHWEHQVEQFRDRLDSARESGA